MPLPERATWLIRLAAGDLAGARAILDAQAAPPRLAAYLAHQAVELALKGSIVCDGSEPPWTHDLAGLAALAPERVRSRLTLERLGGFESVRVMGRYPSSDAELIDRPLAARLLDDAAWMVETVSAAIDVPADAREPL